MVKNNRLVIAGRLFDKEEEMVDKWRLLRIPFKEPTSALLEKHVSHSNGIEGIWAGFDDPLFNGHLRAARTVCNVSREMRAVVEPERIHRTLMAGDPRSDPGNFRRVNVVIRSSGGTEARIISSTPDWEKVLELMKKWNESLEKDLRKVPKMTSRQKARMAWHYHHWFETIHPFRDGNGRVSRLILNNIRLVCGLSWLVISYEKRWPYYDSIDQWRRKNKKLYADKEGGR